MSGDVSKSHNGQMTPQLEVHDTLERSALFSAEVVGFNVDSRA